MQKIKLTPYQSIFYYEWLSNPLRSDYNIVADNMVSGQIDLQRFIDSFKKIINQHFITSHTISNQVDGIFWQPRSPASTEDIFTYHHSALTNDEIDKIVSTPFNLEKDVLGKAHIINLGQNQYRIIFVLHHIMVDGVSTQEFWDKISQYYNNIDYPLPSLTIQTQMHQTLNETYDKILQTQKVQMENFWQKRLKGIKNVDLTFLKSSDTHKERQPRPFITEYLFSYDEQINKKVRTLRRKYKLTTYMFGQLVMALLLHKLVREQDIPLVYPVVMNEGKDLLYGAHVNTLPIVYHFDDQTTLQTVINNMLDYYKEIKTCSAKYLPIYDIIPYAENPHILDIAFVQTFFRDHKINLNGMIDDQANHEFQIDLANKLVFEQEEYNNQINYRVKFSDQQLDRTLVKQLISLYQKLFLQLLNYLANDQVNILTKDIQLLDDNDYQILIYDKNTTQKPYAKDKTVAQLFEQQTDKTPLNTAVIFNDLSLSYQEINAKANQLAHYLKTSFDVQPNDFIGLYLDRSEQIVICILAILKAGGAYVPMDPTAPDDRNRFIIQDTKLKTVITQATYASKLTLLATDVTFVSIDQISFIDKIKFHSSQNLIVETQPDDLAYVIYTSGTTGNPKGTLIEQHNINRLIINANFVDISETDRLLSISGYQFDASIYDIFGALLNGAATVIAEKDNFLDLDKFNQLIAQHKVTNFFATAAFFNILADAQPPNLAQLNYILAGGEALSAVHVNKFRTQYPHVKLVNGYGPTETTTFAVTYLINQAKIPFTHNVPIGVPLTNTTLYLLDEQLHPVPLGAIGELYIGGAGVGRGYLNNPEMTNKVFIPNPFQTREEKRQNYNHRLYKTGDLVRYLPDGNVQYIGRNDFQVKIRGFRIELGEIEARLISHPAIKQAIVVALKSHSDNKYLAAYYVADSAIEESELLTYLQQTLPEYMLPAALVHLDALPVNTNGKVDRKALPQPTFFMQNQYVAPSSLTEQLAVETFAELFGLEAESISVTDDFFRLGGNSILAIKLSAKLARQFDKAIHVADIFTHRTAQGLARLIDSHLEARQVITITTVDSPEQQRLSFAQERLWFIDSYEGGSNAYNIPLVFKVTAKADIARIKHAILIIVQRHAVLRSLIKTTSDGQGYQQVVTLQQIPLPVQSLVCDSTTQLDSEIFNHVHRIFALERELPISVQCYQLEQEQYMSIVIHHIAFDGWSVDLFIHELVNAYTQLANLSLTNLSPTTELELPPIEVQYKDFALWQRHYLQDEVLERQLQFWQQQLAGFEPLNLPTDYVRPLQIDYSGCDVTFELDEALSQGLRQLASELNVSMYTVLLSGFYLLLGSFSNQKDIVVGSPIAGRHYQGIENTMGFFVNTLALRQNIEPSTSLKAFILQTSSLINEAQKYQDLPFEKLVEALSLEKDASRHPIFQVMFGVQSFGASASNSTCQQLFEIYQSSGSHYQTAKFDMTVMLDDSDAMITASFNYATALYDKQTVHRYIAVYQSILTQYTTLYEMQKPLTELHLIDNEAYQQSIFEWNNTQQPYAVEKTVAQLFERQVQNKPLNTAVISNCIEITYAELNQKANQLAHYLQQTFTIQPNDLIGLYLDRSEQIVITILAILKAGGAYVPMDPAAPDVRNHFIMQDAKIKTVITQTHYAGKLNDLMPDLTVLSIDQHELIETIRSYSVDNILTQTTPDDLAYVIYTSGTTGTPKGTLIEHHNINRLIINANFVKINESDRLLSISGYQFDASIYDFFGSLLNGAAITIVDKDIFLNLEQFDQLIDDYKITNFFATTAFFNTLVDSEITNLSRLNYLLFGGEAVSVAHVNKFRARYPNVKLVHVYGPTETTTYATAYLTNQANLPFNSTVAIGKPLTNTTLYILDEQRRPVPIGAIGELYIGGAGVGRGYLNNPEMTNKVFISNPFQTLDEKAQGYNARIYKTGDRVRYLSDGNVEYIGRNDFQVKIRGFRVELAEIEAHLISHSEIKQAIVLALTNNAENKYLAAYYVAKKALGQDLLLDYLQQSLPEYMLPAALIHLEAMPINMNGKIDRNALPIPQLTNAQNYIAPSNMTETIFCQTFANVLRLEVNSISIEDDFFKLGGDSISSIQLASRIKQQLNYYLSIKEIFSLRTVKALSHYIIKNQDNSTPVIESEQGVLTGNIPLAPIQQWFFHNIELGQLPDYSHWNQSFLIKVPLLDIDLLKLSMSKLVEYHDILRVTYANQAVGCYQPTQQKLPFDNANVSGLSNSEITELLTDWQSHLDFNQGFLFHMGYLEGYADNTARIHVAAHHLNIDAVSWRIIKNDLQSLYQFFAEQKPNDPSIKPETILGNKGTSYRQWINKLQTYPLTILQEDNNEQRYWRQLLADFEHYNQYLNTYRVDTLYRAKIALSKEYTALLLRETNQVFTTEINDILLTALAQSLKLMFNNNHHYILLEGHGREDLFTDIDINNTVGWFTCMYPVKLYVDHPDIIKNVTTIKDSLRTIPHHGLGYGVLIGYIKQVLPSICFNYLGQFDSRDQGTQWLFSNEDTGLSISTNNRTTDLLSLNGGIVNEQLQFAVESYLSPAQAENFSVIFTQQLEQLIAQLSQINRGYLTLSDIDHIISQELLDTLQTKDEIEAIYPANSLQQGFIYHAVAQGESDNAYRIQIIWDYYNSLHVDLVKQAWQLTQTKYPSLRLRFSWSEEFIQIIDKNSSFNWIFIDLSEQDQQQQQASIDALIEQDREIGYNLNKGQLFRIYLVKFSEKHYRCIFNNHHAILDGWSLPILLNNVHENYLALLNHQPITVQEDTSYLEAQSVLQMQSDETQAFWKNYLNQEHDQENFTSILKPEAAHINLSDHKYVADPQEVSIVFNQKYCKQLKALCKTNDFTLNALIQYCWHQQLSLFGNTKTTIIGMTVSGRNLPIDGIESSVGLYINTLPVMLEHTDDTVINNIKNLQTHINNVNNHSNTNLIQLQKSGTRLFNSLFVFENYPISDTTDNQLHIEFKEGREKLDYPLGIVAFERNEEVTVKVKYAGELFDTHAIERVLRGIKLILEQLVEHPIIHTREMKLLTQNEYQQLIANQSENRIPFIKDKLISQLFEQQVLKTPNHIAVVYEDVQLTYQALNNYSNQLAHYLRDKLDIQPDDLIGLYLDKSQYMIISILAILKAGAAYVPISPSTPTERVELMMTDTQAKAILTNDHYSEQLSTVTKNIATKNAGYKIITIDNQHIINLLSKFSQQDMITSTQSNNLAYIIYTSGTTGKPKGVMIEHQTLSNLATVQQDILDLAPCHQQSKPKNVLWYSSYVFDAHAFEVYNALLNGHGLHILTESKRLDFTALSSYIRDNEIDFAFIPPALLDQDELLQLPTLTVGGEAASSELVNRYCQQDIQFINVYGPSETTVWAMAHRYKKNDINTNIGKAIHNVCLYILDDYLRPVPPGVIGELYIGGAGVGRGYLNNPEMTNKVFIPNPFQTREEKRQNYNHRLYKTGDLVRYLPDGNVQYIGRNDFQVKIRGFRIELGEIEARLISHPAIKQAIVLALKSHSDNKYLAAYYVADSATEESELLTYLQQTLPEYMLPAALVHLDALPVNTNGKVDRKALPIPSLTLHDSYVAPSSLTEQVLIETFAQVLGLEIEPISVTDDFFRLGGNSILAIKLSAKLARQFDKAIHVADIFTHRTAQGLARLIDSHLEARQVIAITTVDSPEQQRLSFAQERLWFIDSYEGGSNAYNIPLVFKVTAKADIARIKHAILIIVQRHAVLRSLIKTTSDGQGYQQVVTLQQIPLPVQSLVCDSTTQLDSEIFNHVQRIFALERELPISVQCYQLEQEQYMSIVIHHIAFDGWSVDLFIHELVNAYTQLANLSLTNLSPTTELELPPIEVQYKDFALWQRHYLQDEVLERQLQFWQQQLAGFEPLNLPTDYVRPLQIDYSGCDVTFELDEALSQGLRQLASELNVSMYTVLLSGFYLLLGSFSNQKDIVVGSPIAGRHYQGIENTMGFFVNTLALRQNIEPSTSLKAFILQTSSLINEAQKYQDLPFEKLVEALSLEKDASRHPIFQVMFGVQSFGTSVTGETDHQLFEIYQTAASHYQTAKFDMTVMLNDSKTAIAGIFNYAKSLYNEQTVQHYITVYRCILSQFFTMCKQRQPISALHLIDNVTYQQSIIEWNKTRCDYPKNVTIHDLFEKQVDQTPHNLALVYENDRLTYRELNEQANQLAHYLREQFTIQPDDLIALCMDRSKYMLISILAILKAGAAYVPIDPNTPEERISFMLTDTKAKVILTTNRSYGKIKSLASTLQVAINLQTQATITTLAQYSKVNLTPSAKPQNLAYVIYTSGTTGNPKGVMLEHQGAVNRIVWMHEQYPISESDHILQKTNYTFDVSVWELFWANWYGACIVFAHSELYKDNVYLSELIEQEQITVLHFVPSMLVAFVETLEAQPALQPKVQNLKYLFCSGEALNLYEVKKCQQLIPTCQVHNLYGPTEATVDVLYYDCNNPDISQVLIGKPIANTSAYVLNELLQPVPIGAIGELFVGGDGVARGYLNNIPLSNERFISNPFQTEEEKQQHYNGRIYKTGDLVRTLADGNIEYLGRNDFQVKIRGFRIELGEIEARLTQYQDINHSVVIAYEQSSGSKYLVAYYLASEELDSELLQNHLHETLPSYMVPSAFIYLSELPITSNGKLNRKALPKPELTDRVEYLAAESNIEIRLSEIFAIILKISKEEISMLDNFFKLGGNSILAMMLSNRINDAFQIKLRLADILNTRTIGELAIKISETKPLFNPLVTLNTAADRPQLFMIHPGLGGCDVYSSLAQKLSSQFSCHGIDSYNLYHENKIDDLKLLTQYYLKHIKKILNKEQSITLFGWSLGGHIALEIAAQLEGEGLKAIKVYLLDTWLLNKEDLASNSRITDLADAMKSLKIPDSLKEKVASIAEIDNTLVTQPLSARLKHTQIVLFKAIKMINDNTLYQKYPLNNIDAYITAHSQLKLVELDCDHYQIIEREQEIINQMV